MTTETGANTLDALVCQLVLSGVELELIEAPELSAHVEATAHRLLRACGATAAPPPTRMPH